MTLNQIIYDIKNRAAAGPESDNDNISNRHIEFLIHNTRAFLISQRTKDLGRERVDRSNQKIITSDLLQVIPCLEMEMADASECCGVSSGCVVLKSKELIPSIVQNTNNAYVTVSSVDRSVLYQYTSPTRSRWQKHSRYTGNRPYFYILENRLYIVNDEYTEKVRIEAIFEEPTKISRFKDCNGNDCYDINNDNYPIPSWLLIPLSEMVLENITKTTNRPRDLSNDSQGVILQQSQQ